LDDNDDDDDHEDDDDDDDDPLLLAAGSNWWAPPAGDNTANDDAESSWANQWKTKTSIVADHTMLAMRSAERIFGDLDDGPAVLVLTAAVVILDRQTDRGDGRESLLGLTVMGEGGGGRCYPRQSSLIAMVRLPRRRFEDLCVV
jgi:hypothetical protein